MIARPIGSTTHDGPATARSFEQGPARAPGPLSVARYHGLAVSDATDADEVAVVLARQLGAVEVLDVGEGGCRAQQCRARSQQSARRGRAAQ
ncbi:MAG: hypothetical protein ACYCSF_07565 [Acidimicrobiales bacterium]